MRASHVEEDFCRRCPDWDYRQPCYYLLTLTVAGRRPILGSLVSENEVRRTDLGCAVTRCWAQIPDHQPLIELQKCVVMPDHFHGLLRVKGWLPKPLGESVRGFKIGVNKAFVAAGGTLPLWNPGFNDSILWHAGQLPIMDAYVLDNPRRLWIRRQHPDLFRTVHDVVAGGTRFAALGNHFLLRRPVLLPVQCSRRLDEAALARQQAEFLAAAHHGAVLVSPCISPGEKRIARAALDAGLPLVALLENGFGPYYKPPGRYLDACAAGHLLLLAPWPYHREKRAITRSQCLALNGMASRICGEAGGEEAGA